MRDLEHDTTLCNFNGARGRITIIHDSAEIFSTHRPRKPYVLTMNFPEQSLSPKIVCNCDIRLFRQVFRKFVTLLARLTYSSSQSPRHVDRDDFDLQQLLSHHPVGTDGLQHEPPSLIRRRQALQQVIDEDPIQAKTYTDTLFATSSSFIPLFPCSCYVLTHSRSRTSL